MSKLVVFDVDGTFLDSYTLYERYVKEYSEQQGLPMPCIKTIATGYGNPNDHDFGWGVSKEEQLRHLHATFRITDDYSMSGEDEHTPGLFHGVEEALIHLKDLNYTLAIVTSKPEAPLLHLLEYHEIGKMFSAYRTLDDIHLRNEKEKPEPDMLLSVMRELKFAPEDTVMIGDTTMDILMGISSGTHTIGVTWGTHPKEFLADAGAHHIVETHFPDVVPVVREIFG